MIIDYALAALAGLLGWYSVYRRRHDGSQQGFASLLDPSSLSLLGAALALGLLACIHLAR